MNITPPRAAAATLTALTLAATLAACTADTSTSTPSDETSIADGESSSSTSTNSENEDREADGVLFDFSIPSMGPAKKITIALPTELLDIATLKIGSGPEDTVPYEETRILDSVTVTAYPLDQPVGSLDCALETSLTWAPGALETVIATPVSRAQDDELQATLTEEQRSVASALGILGRFWQDWVPSSEFIQIDGGVYIDTDYETVIELTRCAVETDDAGAHVSFRGIAGSDDFPFSQLASAEVAVFTNGDLYLKDAGVASFTTDINGDWTRD